jgi:transcriptional regulator with XRE-family HTH domain
MPAAPAQIVGMGRQEFASRRHAAGLTMVETGKLMGVTERTVWRWEHGTSRIDSFKAAAIRAELVPGLWAKLQQPDDLSGSSKG